MDLTHTLSVEHADSQSDGCIWHQDPECLCDVIVKEPMGDDYVTPPWLEALFVNDEHGDDTWLHQAFDFMVGQTLITSITDADDDGPGGVLALLDNEPLIEDLMAGMTAEDAWAKHETPQRPTQLLRKYLNLRVHGRSAMGIRNNHVREHVIERHFGGGERVIDIYRDLQSKGVPCVEVTMYQWVQRERNERAAA